MNEWEKYDLTEEEWNNLSEDEKQKLQDQETKEE
jgi:hypothetical protein